MNIRVDLDTPIKDGTEVVFRSPVDCSQVTGLIVYYNGGSQEFMLADAHGNNVGVIDHLFAENVAVKVILDVTTSMAFVQNADTNAYLEGRFNGLSDGIICEASGSTISINDSSNKNLQGLSLYGKTTQDGTPTPTAPVELKSVGASGNIGVTVAGAQLIDLTGSGEGTATIHGITWSWKSGVISAKGTATSYSSTKERLPFSLPKGTTGTFYISGTSNGVRSLMFVKDANGNVTYPDGKAFTLDGTEQEVSFFAQVNNGLTVDATIYPMLNIGNTALPYEPYNGQTLTASTPNGLPGIPVSSGGNYTDENGQQWICDEIDFARGVYVQRVIIIAPNAVSVYGTNAGQLPFGYFSTESALIVGSKVLCSHLPPNDMPVYADNNKVVGAYINAEKALRFRISATNTADEIKAFIANNTVEFLCALANPIETPLSAEELEAYAVLHTNKPNTTVLNDAGAGIAVGYVADTKTYIDNKFTELQNAILASGANV